MRRPAAMLILLACCSSQEVVTTRDFTDATTVADTSFSFGDAAIPDVVVPVDATFNGGGPFACAGCVCDGTLYSCFVGATAEGGCPPDQGGLMPMMDDASTACDASACHQLPIACLPKPTCECITATTHLDCTVDPSGNGFILACPFTMPRP